MFRCFCFKHEKIHLNYFHVRRISSSPAGSASAAGLPEPAEEARSQAVVDLVRIQMGYWDIPEGSDCVQKTWITTKLGTALGKVKLKGSARSVLVLEQPGWLQLMLKLR